MAVTALVKSASELKVTPNLLDYDASLAPGFWERARAELDGLPGDGGLNIAHEAVDRHAAGARARPPRAALARQGRRGARLHLRATSRARDEPLRQRARGARRRQGRPRLRARRAHPGALRRRARHAQEPAASSARSSRRSARSRSARGSRSATRRVLVTTRAALRSARSPAIRADAARPRARDPRRRGRRRDGRAGRRTTTGALLAAADDTFDDRPDRPRGRRARCTSRAARPARRRARCTCTSAVVAHHVDRASSRSTSIPDDVFWCTADPGWVTGTSYGIIAPLTNGVTSIVDEARLRRRALVRDPRATSSVTVWYTAPTAIRMLMKAGAELAREHDFPRLRFLASVGEPLNPEAVVWGEEAFGLPFHDNWWQTETGGIMIANFAAHGHPPRLDGPAAARHRGRRSCTAARTAASTRSTSPASEGELALRPGWPSMFRAYLRRAGALREVLRRRLVPDRRPRAARRRRLLLVRRPRRRRDQDRRPPDRPVRGRERAARAPGRRRGRRDRQARPGRRRGREGVRHAQARLRALATSSRSELLGSRAQAARRRRRAEGDRVRRRACRRRAAARSCAACSRRASSACPRATSRRWRRPVSAPAEADARSRHRDADARARARARAAARDAAHPPLRGACAELYSAGKIRGFLHLYIGEEAVAVGAMQALDAGRRDRRHLPRARPRARARACPPASLMAEMYGKANGCSRGRGGSMHFFDVARALLRRQRDRRRRAADRGRARARRQAAADARASPPASSATAPSPRASSTSR